MKSAECLRSIVKMLPIFIKKILSNFFKNATSNLHAFITSLMTFSSPFSLGKWIIVFDPHI